MRVPEDVSHGASPCDVHVVCRVLYAGRAAEGESVGVRGPVRVGCVGNCNHTSVETKYKLLPEFLKVVRAVPGLSVEARVMTEFSFGQVVIYFIFSFLFYLFFNFKFFRSLHCCRLIFSRERGLCWIYVMLGLLW